MIKTSLKMLTVTALFAAFGLPTFAQDTEEGFSSSLSGQVRVNYVNGTTKASAMKDSKAQTVSKSNVATDNDDDSYAQVNFKYVAGGTSATSFIRFVASGEKRINFTGTTTSGDWTGTGKVEFDETFNSVYSEGGSAKVSGKRDSYVSLSDGAMTFTLGFKQHFESHRKDNAYLFNGHYEAKGTTDADSVTALDTGITLDNRINAFRFDYNIDDSISVGLLYGADNEAKAFGEADRAVVKSSQTTTTGLFFDFDSDGIAATFEYGTSGETGMKDSDVATDFNDKAKTSASHMGLGVSYKMDALAVALNYSTYDLTDTALTDATTDADATLETKSGYSWMDLNVGYALDEDSGVGFSYSSKTDITVKSEDREAKGAATSTTIELGYQTKIAGVLVRASYATADFTGAYGEDSDKKDAGSAQYIKARMQYSF